MTAVLVPPEEYGAWDGWLQALGSSSVRQCSLYARALALYGHRSEILAVRDSERFRAGALLSIRDPGFGVGPLVRTSGGINLDDPEDHRNLAAFLEALLDRARDLRASTLRVYLNVPRRIGDRSNPAATALEQALRTAGFTFDEPMGTYLVDLSVDSEEALLAGFGKNPRRHIRKAQREGMIVDRTTDPEAFGAFAEAHHAMCQRKGLEPLPERFAAEVLLPLSCAGLGDLFVARYRDVPRNYLYVGAIGNPSYHWGALVDAAREPGCPQTGQFLHYVAMCHYRSLGKPVYNFGGSPGPVPDPAHPNFTVWKFKYEFSGEYVDFFGSWQRTLRPVGKTLLNLARRGITLKRRLLRSTRAGGG